MDEIHIILSMDLSDKAPNGPGWYLRRWFDKSVSDPIFVTEDQAQAIGVGIDAALGDVNTHWQSVAQSGSKLVYNALEQQLKEAEEQASRIGSLRKRLSELKADNEIGQSDGSH